MQGLILVLGAGLGVVAALYFPGYIPSAYTTYVAVGLLAALDTVVGGFNASRHGKFRLGIFISGFFLNTALAVALTWVGKLLSIDLYLAAILVFGARIFQNFAELRRTILKSKADADKI